ncbi:unnamed protein product [Chrysodeixis includens]|uniref:Uncharacterized protein n=1 Tax=Chrysodeixis includens TaxID=689277 RepID=A0A9N8Q362_CHRIL|nr:unnamed protein product [Chrysodeixis includens]
MLLELSVEVGGHGHVGEHAMQLVRELVAASRLQTVDHRFLLLHRCGQLVYEPASERARVVLLEHVFVVHILEHNDSGGQPVVHVGLRAGALAQQTVAVAREQLGGARGARGRRGPGALRGPVRAGRVHYSRYPLSNAPMNACAPPNTSANSLLYLPCSDSIAFTKCVWASSLLCGDASSACPSEAACACAASTSGRSAAAPSGRSNVYMRRRSARRSAASGSSSARAASRMSLSTVACSAGRCAATAARS